MSNISITNLEATRLSVAEAMVLYRVRWQIELVFKLLKTHGGLDKSNSSKKWRILAEIYAKLLAMLIEHWLLLCSGFICPYHSLTKAAKAVKKQALAIASAMARASIDKLIAVLETAAATLIAGTRIYKRNDCPTTYQRLVVVSDSLHFFS